MQKHTAKPSTIHQETILGANRHLGIPSGKNEIPGLSGWQEINPMLPTKFICLTEGEMNFLTLYQYEIPMGILHLPFGAGRSGSERHHWIQSEYDNLLTYDEIYLCFDDDEEGRKIIAEVSQRLGAHKCPIVKLPYKTAHLCAQNGVSAQIIHACFNEAKTIDPLELRRALEYADKIQRGINHVTDAELGYALPWDKAFGKINFRPGELTVWSGTNGHGKSQLLGYLMLDQIRQGASVCIASMELSPVKTLMRMVRQVAGIKQPSDDFIGHICEWWGDRLWLFDLIGTAKGDRLIDVFTYARKRYGVDVFVIDSLMKCGLADDDYAGQKRFLDQLSDFKNEFNCHVHIVCHVKKREDENTVTGKLDVKGVGGITDLADNHIAVWRNKPKERMTEEAGVNHHSRSSEGDGLIYCDKQRFGDWEGKISFWFDKESLQYRGYDADKVRSMIDA
ncbi:MAG: AAA family ATPase [Pseudomonadota bacterium]